MTSPPCKRKFASGPSASRSTCSRFALPERFQIPFAFSCTQPTPQDIEITAVYTYFEVNFMLAVPLIEYFLDEIVAIIHLKTNRPLVSLVTRVAFYVKCHFLPCVRGF